jgi:hypothetical protein
VIRHIGAALVFVMAFLILVAEVQRVDDRAGADLVNEGGPA